MKKFEEERKAFLKSSGNEVQAEENDNKDENAENV